MTPPLPWYVLMSKPRQEERLARALASAGLEVYLPRLKRRNRRLGGWRSQPLFPRYLFVRLDAVGTEQGWTRLQWTEGLSHVVAFDGRPALLDGRLVEHWRGRLADLDGDALLRLRSGDRVRVTEGPFRDYEAVFDRHLNGEGRVAILLNLVGRRTAVQLALRDLQKVA